MAIAWRAASAGLRTTVCDPTPGGGAAAVAAGMLAAVTEAWFGEEHLTELSVASAARWPDFAADVEAASGMPTGFAAAGTLLVAVDADDLVVVDRLGTLHQRLGLASVRLRTGAARAMEPALSPAVRGGLHAPSDHRVDPRALCGALRVACQAAGVMFVEARVASIDHNRGRVTGVTVDGGHHAHAGAVVLAAGAWSGTVAGLPPMATPPVRPVAGEVVTLRLRPGAPVLLGSTVRGVVHGSSVYLVPRDDGRVVIGATSYERGFDTRVIAGGVHELLRDAALVVPGIDELEWVDVRAGLRPGSPDNVPLVGPGGVDGLVLATGHHRNGVLLTPITADAVTALLLGDEPPAVVTTCDPRRFA
jgi:glycine oxidase